MHAIRKLRRLIFEPLVVISAEALTGLQEGTFGLAVKTFCTTYAVSTKPEMIMLRKRQCSNQTPNEFNVIKNVHILLS